MGFFVPEPKSMGAPLPSCIGPLVLLRVCTPERWSAVVLLITRDPTGASLTYEYGGGAAETVAGQVIDTVREWTFVRFPIAAQPGAATQLLRYTVHAAAALTGQISVAGCAEEWALAAYSCYDQRRDIGAVLWQHIAGAGRAGLAGSTAGAGQPEQHCHTQALRCRAHGQARMPRYHWCG